MKYCQCQLHSYNQMKSTSINVNDEKCIVLYRSTPSTIFGTQKNLYNAKFVLEVHRLRRTCGHVDVGTCPHQVLAATLTLSQPEGADYAHPILVSTPSFESDRRACIMLYFSCIKVFLSNNYGLYKINEGVITYTGPLIEIDI